MSHDEQRLVRHLVWVIVNKLLALAALWWVFVRDQRVSADAAAATQHLAAPALAQGEPR